MRNLVLLCLLATGAQATIQNVSVLGTTATQALIHYTAPNNSPCNIEVSESPTYRPLVHDVDGTLFASAASDTRPGSVTNGAERLFAVGKRAAEVALDTARYSRALQTATQHYFRITCPSTGDQATGTFQTNTILFGQGYAEPEASDPNRPGSYAYPTLSTNDRTQAIVDPQTGLLIKRLSLPKQTTANPSGVPFPTVRASAWNNLTNLQAADGQAATVSGATGPLFMGLNSRSPYLNSFMYPWAGAYQGTESAFGYYQVHVVAAVNPGGNAPSNPDDATIVVCLTYDGATCYPGSAQYQARLTTGMSDTAFGTTNTVDLWQAMPGTTLPNWPMMSERNGNVSCDGSPTVTLTAGQPFGIHWGPGSNLNINGADYPIATIAHTAKLTLAVNCPTSLVTEGAFDAGSNIFRTVADTFQPSDVGRQIEVVGAGGGAGIWLSSVGRVIDARTILTNDGPPVTGVTTQFGFTYGYVANNFGVLISKKSASPDTIAVDYAYVNYELDFYEQFVDQGGLPLCGTTTVTGANGRPGYSCVISGGQMYWVDAASAETHFLGLLSTNSPDAGCGGIGQLHDAKDPDTFYCGQKGPIYSVKYYGNHLEPTALNPGGDFGIFQSFPNCDTSKGKPPYTNQQPCLVTTLLTPGTDVIALAGAFSNNPQYPPAMDTVNFRTLWFNGADENGDLLFNTYRGANDTLGWFFVFRPSATSNSEGGSSTGPAGNHGCVGAGHPGCIIAAMTSWASKGCRWCPIKGVGSPYPGWMYIGTYGWTNSQPGSGPYYIPVVDGTPNGTLNYLDGAASLIDCPANQFGATGHNCSKLTVGSEPLSPPHGAGETGLPGELGPAMLGDYFATQVQLPINSAEQMMLIAKTPGAVPGTWVYTLWRKINSANGANYATTGPNPSLYTVCGANQYLADQPSGESVLWNFLADPHGTNSTGQTIPPQPNSTLGHPFYSHGNYASNGTPNTDHRCAAGQYACYSTVLLNNLPFSQAIQSPLPTGVMVSNPGFGQTGAADYTNIQAHPTGGGRPHRRTDSITCLTVGHITAASRRVRLLDPARTRLRWSADSFTTFRNRQCRTSLCLFGRCIRQRPSAGSPRLLT
jgi:hypothetical protein